MKLLYLGAREDFIPVIAQWYFEEWGQDATLAEVTESVGHYCHSTEIPLMIVAVDGGELMGAAQLKAHEMADLYPEKENWLGGVYVAPGHRGKKVAKQLALRIIDEAKRLGLSTIHLQTVQLDGGLYGRLGWRPVGQISYRGQDVLVMEYKL